MQAVVFRLTETIGWIRKKSKWYLFEENEESVDEIIVSTNEIDCDDNFIFWGHNAREQEHKETKLNEEKLTYKFATAVTQFLWDSSGS